MSIFPFFKRQTSKDEAGTVPSGSRAAVPLELEALTYLKSLINREESITGILKRIKEAKSLPDLERETVYIQTYYALEDFISKNKPLIVKRILTKEEIRQEIRKNLDISRAHLPFRTIFLQDSEELLALFELSISDFVKHILIKLGADRLKKVALPLIKSTLLDSVLVTADGLDFAQVYKGIKQADTEQLPALLKSLYSILYQEIINSFGKNVADGLVEKNYSFVKDSYTYDVVVQFLQLLPEGILERERVAFLTREELENQAKKTVEERVKREIAEETAQKMKNTIEELDKTKRAMVNLLEDISKEKVISEKRALDLQKFQLAVENAYEHIIITDENSKILYLNNTVERITGYSREEVLGKTPAVWGGIMPEAFYKNMWQIIKIQKKPFIGEIKNRRKNGEEYFASINIAPILDEKNEVKFFVGIERDITHEKNEKAEIERKIEERTSELKEERARLKASLGSLSFGFVITDIEKNIITINEAGKRMFYAPFMENLGDSNVIKSYTIENMYAHFSPSLDIKSELDKVIKTAASYSREFQIENHFLLIRIAPIVIADFKLKVIGTVIVAEDITERKLLDRTRDEFFSIASHELRTPLTAIRGNTALILQFFADKLRDPELKEMISDVNESSIRLIQIVNDFLDMSRLELSKVTFKKEEVNLVNIIKEVIKEYETTGSGKMLYLNFIEPKEVTPTLIADSDRVKQIIINLIGNAIKYTEKGGVTISLEKNSKYLKVLVADTGKGVAPESQKLLFRKFQQATENIYTRDSTKGTGLGLYISKLMAEGMGGEAVLESSIPGKGSVFSFSLPLKVLQTTGKLGRFTNDQNSVDITQIIQSTK